jgi:ABC-2 family transporter protein
MSHPGRSRPALEKEVRALLPTFVASAAAVILGALVTFSAARPFVVAAFCWGVLALGAHSIGHEYAHRTLPLLLAQPASRNRILARKALVLLPMVLGLTMIAGASLRAAGFERIWRADELETLLVFAPLSAISLAPWLSMLARGTLPGIVFTMGIMGALILAGEFAATLRYGYRDRLVVELFKVSLLWSTIPPLCAAAAIAAWRQFGRLQAIDGHRDLQIPGWVSPARASAPAGGVRRQHPFWMLLRKEIHLQQITFVVVAIYVVAWTALWALEHQAPEVPRLPLQPLTALYRALIAVLIGSVASAEERHLGTLPSELLLPIAAWKQWAIKAATALGLALLLGIALPYVLYAVVPPPDDPMPLRLRREPPVVILLTMLSLYVSSLCGSAVRAMVASIPVVVGSALYTGAAAGLVTDIAVRAVRAATVSESNRVRVLQRMAMETRIQYALILAAIVTIALLLRFAFVNHRSGEHRPGTVIMQGTVLLLAFTLCLALPVLIFR